MAFFIISVGALVLLSNKELVMYIFFEIFMHSSVFDGRCGLSFM